MTEADDCLLMVIFLECIEIIQRRFLYFWKAIMINISEIRNVIKNCLDQGNDSFVIFPYGEIGVKVHEVL